MNSGGDAAEQIVRMSLEGTEVALRITGNAAKNITALLIAALKEDGKTKGKARLSSMLKSGKELKVFSIQQKDLKQFTKEARKYGVLYNVIRQKGNKNPDAEVDIIARAEDAAKISHIIKKFKLVSVDKAEVVRQVERDRAGKPEQRAEPEKDANQLAAADKLLDEAFAEPAKTERKVQENPQAARMEKGNLSGKNYREEDSQDTFRAGAGKQQEKPSVREKIVKQQKEQAGKEKGRSFPKDTLPAKPKNKNEVTKGR